MTPPERTAVFALASIFSLRMFGLFMLLPVLAIYTSGLPGATPFLTGLALGIYGLTQAMFQIPFGMVSDRIDRKLVITAGLMVFAAGSAVAALSDSILWLIVGRAVQGSGAVSAVILALTADLTQSQNRTGAMAIIGITIGATFILSLMLAPVLQHAIGIDGMFWTISGLSLVAIVVLFKVVPEAHSSRHANEYSTATVQIRGILRTRGMGQLFCGIFVSHMVLTALFLVLPAAFAHKSGLGLSQHWKLYLPVLVVSVIGMVPFVVAASNRARITWTYRTAILLMGVVMFNLVAGNTLSLTGLLIWVTLFFVAFNALESLLPSLVTQIAPANNKGTAIGIYNTCLFTGVFIGGTVGGAISGHYGMSGVIVFCSAAVFVWLLIACLSSGFKLTSSRIVKIGILNGSQRSELIARIGQLKGIEEVKVYSGGSEAFLEVDDSLYDSTALDKIIQNTGDQ
jgi:MFS family permease